MGDMPSVLRPLCSVRSYSVRPEACDFAFRPFHLSFSLHFFLTLPSLSSAHISFLPSFMPMSHPIPSNECSHPGTPLSHLPHFHLLTHSLTSTPSLRLTILSSHAQAHPFLQPYPSCPFHVSLVSLPATCASYHPNTHILISTPPHTHTQAHGLQPLPSARSLLLSISHKYPHRHLPFTVLPFLFSLHPTTPGLAPAQAAPGSSRRTGPRAAV